MTEATGGKRAQLARCFSPCVTSVRTANRMILAALRAGDEPGLRLAVRTDVTQGLKHLAS